MKNFWIKWKKNMSKRTVDKKRVDVFNLEFLNEHVRKERTQYDSGSSNEESFLDSKSEVLWSREKNEIFSENDFFRGFCDSFSDRSNSSCSWHNDDFDMNSSIKVKLSLEAIEDTLYEQKQSNLISKTVFEECCEWAKKFSYFRLKGEQVVKPIDDTDELYTFEENGRSYFDHSTSDLQIQGVKMAIHLPKKHSSKSLCIDDFDNLDEESDYLKENFENDEECYELDTRIAYEKISQPPLLKNEVPSTHSIEAVQEKIVEKIAFEIWPKVLAILQKTNSSHIPDVFEDFQLPPIVTALQQRKIPQRRPKTEGTDVSVSDFPKLSSILTISPKILQNKQESGSRSSRPNSEIHLSRRNYTVPIPRRKHESLKVFHNVSKLNKNQQTAISSSKQIVKGEKDYLSTSLLLPALEEDIPESSSMLRGFSLEPEFKNIASARCETIHLSKKSECFLPPIERKSPVPASVKLTRNLFTFFGTPLKFDKHEGNVSAIQPTSRPCTSVSRKGTKFSGNVNNKLNDGHPSMKKTSLADMKRVDETNPCKQVTLFPIVTSLTTDKERNLTSAKRGFLNTFTSGKKR